MPPRRVESGDLLLTFLPLLARSVEAPWIVPQIGMAMLGFGENMAFTTIQGELQIPPHLPFVNVASN